MSDTQLTLFQGMRPLFTALALACSAWAAGPVLAQEMPAARVVAEPAQVMEMAPVIGVPGTVISRADARVAAEIAGRVQSIAEVGTMLEAGSPIAELDKRLLSLEVSGIEARIARIEANLGFLNREVARQRELARRNNAPARAVDEVEVQRDVAMQDLAEAQIALERSQINLANATVRAPFPGQVVERLIERGEYVSTGTEVARLVDTSDVEVRARIPVRSAPFVREGMTLVMEGLGRTLTGELRTLVRVGSEVSRTFEIRIALPADEWVTGTPVRVAVPSGDRRDVIAVPRDALVLRQSGTSVFVVTEDRTASRVAVETGTGNGSMIEVRGAVNDGDLVVVRGAERLRDGQTVQLIGSS